MPELYHWTIPAFNMVKSHHILTPSMEKRVWNCGTTAFLGWVSISTKLWTVRLCREVTMGNRPTNSGIIPNSIKSLASTCKIQKHWVSFQPTNNVPQQIWIGKVREWWWVKRFKSLKQKRGLLYMSTHNTRCQILKALNWRHESESRNVGHLFSEFLDWQWLNEIGFDCLTRTLPPMSSHADQINWLTEFRHK